MERQALIEVEAAPPVRFGSKVLADEVPAPDEFGSRRESIGSNFEYELIGGDGIERRMQSLEEVLDGLLVDDKGRVSKSKDFESRLQAKLWKIRGSRGGTADTSEASDRSVGDSEKEILAARDSSESREMEGKVRAISFDYDPTMLRMNAPQNVSSENIGIGVATGLMLKARESLEERLHSTFDEGQMSKSVDFESRLQAKLLKKKSTLDAEVSDRSAEESYHKRLPRDSALFRNIRSKAVSFGFNDPVDVRMSPPKSVSSGTTKIGDGSGHTLESRESFDDRLKRKMNGPATKSVYKGERQVSAQGSGESKAAESFEDRLKRKMEGENKTQVNKPTAAESFEDRLKGKMNGSATTSVYKGERQVSAQGEIEPKAGESFDDRLRRKMEGESKTQANKPTATAESLFEDRLKRKMNGTATASVYKGERQVSAQGGMEPKSGESFDDRLRRKMEGESKTQANKPPATAESLFEDRLKRKMNGSATASVYNGERHVSEQGSGEPKVGESFEDRLKRKMEGENKTQANKPPATAESLFEDRLKSKMNGSATTSIYNKKEETKESFDDRLRRKMNAANNMPSYKPAEANEDEVTANNVITAEEKRQAQKPKGKKSRPARNDEKRKRVAMPNAEGIAEASVVMPSKDKSSKPKSRMRGKAFRIRSQHSRQAEI